MKKGYGFVIYVIKCPQTLNIKYVGFTRRFEQRKYQHQHGYGSCLINKWERFLLKRGLVPIVEILETHTSIFTVTERELLIMKQYLKEGKRLLNTHH